MSLHRFLGKFSRVGLIAVVGIFFGLTPAVAAPAPKGKVAAAAAAPVKKLAPRAQKLKTAKTAPASAITTKRGDRYAAVIIEAATGQVISDDNGDAPRHPASLTKVMTLYLTFEALDRGKLTMDQRLSVSGWASIQSPTKLDLKEGGTITVRDAILGLITKSANDAAVVLAEALSGDEDIFAQRMTEKARQLGMKNTLYRNASGLPNDSQITTARDQAILTLALIRDFPAYYPLFSTQEFVYGRRINTNHNRMLGWYNGAEGLKTGYINASGYNIILTAKRDERRLIGVMMGGDSAQSRDNAIAALMDGAFNGTSSLVASNDRLLPAPKANGGTIVPVAVANTAPAWTPNKDPIGTRISAVNPTAPATAPSLPLANTTNVALTPGTVRNVRGNGNGGDIWAMQVGAFGDTGAARSAIATAQINLPDLRATASIAPVESKGRTLYRARLSGLTQGEASIGCRRLQDQGALDCTVVKVDPSDIDVAAN